MGTSEQNIIQPNDPQRAPLKREAPVREIFKSRLLLQFSSAGFHGGRFARRKGYRLALWSWMASMIDALILLSVSCVFLLMFSWIMKNSMSGVLQNIAQGQDRWILFVEIYALSAWIYLISVRGLTGFTLGEWACDLRLGQPHERLRASYVLRVMLRSSLIVMTGVITLPLLSLLFGRDIPGVFSGLRLFSLK